MKRKKKFLFAVHTVSSQSAATAGVGTDPVHITDVEGGGLTIDFCVRALIATD